MLSCYKPPIGFVEPPNHPKKKTRVCGIFVSSATTVIVPLFEDQKGRAVTMSKTNDDLEAGTATAPASSASVDLEASSCDTVATNIGSRSEKKKDRCRSTWIFSIHTSENYTLLLKFAQYVACVSLAFALFSKEFFAGGTFMAEQVIFFLLVASPIILIHLPIFLSFTFNANWKYLASRQKKLLHLEGLLLSLFVIMILVAVCIVTFLEAQRDVLFHWIVCIPSTTLSVVYYYFAVSSFGPTRKDCLDEKIQSLKTNEKHMQGAYKVFFKLMVRFPLSSLVAWVSVTLYTACLPLQGLTVGYITQAMAEATPNSSFWELFEPGLYFLLASLGMAVFLWTTKLGFAAFGAQVEEYFRLSMTRSVCGVGGQTSAATLVSGDLASRYSRDLAMISNFIDKNKLFTSAGILVSSFVVLFTIDWRMGFFFLISCPALISMLASKPGQAHKAGTLAAARLQSRFENCVELRRTMDLYSAGDYVYDKSVESMKPDIHAIGHSKWVAAHFVAAVHATGLCYCSLIAFAFILYAIPLARKDPTEAVNRLSVAVVILSQLKSPFSQIGQGVEHWLSIAPALFRLNQFSQEEDDREARKRCRYTGKERGGESKPTTCEEASHQFHESLELRDIRFRYGDSGPAVLRGVNAKLETGKYSCIVGGSGAGKSTLLNILTQELVQTEGSMLLDGQEMANNSDGTTSAAAISRYRDQIAIVFQNASFFDGTIAENIRIGKTDATDEEIALAAQRAQCTFIQDLPEGLNTKLGQEFNLSGGQGQRVCLARALCRNPRLLILDEATSALDPQTEKEAVKTFVELARNEKVAVVSVTHRLDTTEDADNIIVLKDGRVAEEGSPHSLYQHQGLFYAMRQNKSSEECSLDDSKKVDDESVVPSKPFLSSDDVSSGVLQVLGLELYNDLI